MCPRSIAGVPLSQALPGFRITAPPSVCVSAVLGALAVWIQQPKKKSVPIEMFVTLKSFRGTFKSFWDFTEVRAQSWYNVRTYHLVKPTFKISLLQITRVFATVHGPGPDGARASCWYGRQDYDSIPCFEAQRLIEAP